ncbi:MAG: hypothetical protein ACLP70_02555 [Streptosporangiaceae bacterium]
MANSAAFIQSRIEIVASGSGGLKLLVPDVTWTPDSGVTWQFMGRPGGVR